jgi:hypothetical protein
MPDAATRSTAMCPQMRSRNWPCALLPSKFVQKTSSSSGVSPSSLFKLWVPSGLRFRVRCTLAEEYCPHFPALCCHQITLRTAMLPSGRAEEASFSNSFGRGKKAGGEFTLRCFMESQRGFVAGFPCTPCRGVKHGDSGGIVEPYQHLYTQWSPVGTNSLPFSLRPSLLLRLCDPCSPLGAHRAALPGGLAGWHAAFKWGCMAGEYRPNLFQMENRCVEAPHDCVEIHARNYRRRRGV